MTQHNITTKYIEHFDRYLLGYVADAEDISFIIEGPDKTMQTTDLIDICEEWEKMTKKETVPE